MLFRKIIALLVVFFAVSGFVIISSSVAGTITMKIGTVWTSDDITPNKSLNYLKPRIEQLTKGAVKVELYKGTLGGERDLFEGVQLGTLQGGAITTGTLGGFIPLAEIFMVPYIFNDYNHLYSVVSGYFGDVLNGMAVEKGMRILGWWTCGGRDLYGNGSIPTKPDDLKGKKIRVMETPFLVELYKHYGALPTPMAYPEVYTALQQGVIDGVQAGVQSYAVGHHEVSKWCVLIKENITATPFVVSEKWWSNLSDDIKNRIEQAVQEATVVNHELDLRYESILEKKWADYGVKVVKGDRAAFKKKAREIYPIFAKRLGGDKWLKWIEEVGEAFPIEEYPSIKQYGGEYQF